MSTIDTVNTDATNPHDEEVRQKIADLSEADRQAENHFKSGREATYHLIGEMAAFIRLVLENEDLLAAAFRYAEELNVPISAVRRLQDPLPK